jgi:hypothetical protein
MTNQEIVNFVAEKLRAQNGSSTSHCGCAYRGENGRRCAVGWLIPDELYKPFMENEVVTQPIVRDVLKQLVSDEQIKLLIDLQDAHDSIDDVHGSFISQFNNNLQYICERHDLQYPAETK